MKKSRVLAAAPLAFAWVPIPAIAGDFGPLDIVVGSLLDVVSNLIFELTTSPALVAAVLLNLGLGYLVIHFVSIRAQVVVDPRLQGRGLWMFGLSALVLYPPTASFCRLYVHDKGGICYNWRFILLMILVDLLIGTWLWRQGGSATAANSAVSESTSLLENEDS